MSVQTKKHVLVIGASGQIGSELTPALQQRHGAERVIRLHNRAAKSDDVQAGPVEIVDVTDRAALGGVFERYDIGSVYHLAALLSATGEKNPEQAWTVNMDGLKNVLDLAVEHRVPQVFWPSSIAAFGPNAPKEQTPQDTVMHPSTIYGVTKVAGELLVNYYVRRYRLDVRSLRYPGLISYKTEPGGGTTDYAVAIFFAAVASGRYDCFVNPETTLPMMYMDDAITATLDLMSAPAGKITVRTSYNLSALSFSAAELAAAIATRVPGFACTYAPDHRQAIADSWPRSIDDTQARRDWGWKPKFDLDTMVDDMLANVRSQRA